MSGDPTTSRPGGRSARVRSAVHRAVEEIVAEHGYEKLTIGAIAERSGVHTTSIYRRWGDLDALILDVAVTRLAHESPVPDTGSLRGDLEAYALQAADGMARPDGMAFLRALLATYAGSGTRNPSQAQHLQQRRAQLEAMLKRAKKRGERTPKMHQVLEGILGPLYFRALFGTGPLNETYARKLVTKLLDHDAESCRLADNRPDDRER